MIVLVSILAAVGFMSTLVLALAVAAGRSDRQAERAAREIQLERVPISIRRGYADLREKVR